MDVRRRCIVLDDDGFHGRPCQGSSALRAESCALRSPATPAWSAGSLTPVFHVSEGVPVTNVAVAAVSSMLNHFIIYLPW